MKWSTRIITVAGIGVYIHWTFLILLGWVAVVHLEQGQTVAAAVKGVAFILAIFGCVVLHELGHALTARRFGIRTRDITLLPIGGIARLERMPEDPGQEFLVAIAGPAVNVVIAALLLVIILGVTQLQMPDQAMLIEGDFLSKLMWVNVSLVIFNLLPAFPMDGGRILRALLARRMPYERATQAAANVGQAMAILFGMLGVLVNWFLLFIAIFVYLGAQAEAQMVQIRTVFAGVTVRDAMMTQFRVLSRSDKLSTAVGELIAGPQHDFPVRENGQVIGMLFRSDLVKALADHGQQAQVGQVMSRDCHVVQDSEMLNKTFQEMQERRCSARPVMHGDVLVGLITLENIAEWAMIHSAMKRHDAHGSLSTTMERA